MEEEKVTTIVIKFSNHNFILLVAPQLQNLSLIGTGAEL